MRTSHRRLALATLVAGAAAFVAVGCGSSSYGGSNSSSALPTAPSATPSGAIVVNIVGTSGSAAFNPNPVTAGVGESVAWHNVDNVAHHIVMDDGSADLGTIAPGASTAAIQVKSSSGQSFHCTIHPSMVGSINGTVTAGGGNCPNGYC